MKLIAHFFTENDWLRSKIIVSGIIMGFSLSPVSAEEGKLDPSIPAQFDQEAFAKELNSGDVTDTGKRSSQDDTRANISVDSYGSRRFVDIVEITPANGPQYFLLDDGYGTPNLGRRKNGRGLKRAPKYKQVANRKVVEI